MLSTHVVTLRLFDDAAPPLQRGLRHVRAVEFPSTGWTWFYVDIDTTAAYTARNPSTDGYPAGVVTPVIDWYGTQMLEVDRLFLATRSDSIPSTVSTTLTPPATITLYASDHAGNVALARCEPEGGVTVQRVMSRTGFASRLFLPLISAGAPRATYRCVTTDY